MKINSERTVFLILVVIKLVIHLWAVFFEGYGIFRDELYYLECTDHLAFGYVDHPPLSIWVLKLFTSVFGDQWQVIRLVPLFVSIASLYVLIRIVKLLNGDVLACWIAGIAFVVAPINLAFSSFYSMNVIDSFFWLIAFYQLLYVLKQPDDIKKWLWLGLIIGMGMMNKISMSWFAIGLIVYLLLTRERKLLLSMNPYISGVMAFIIFLPFVIWNFNHEWAHLEFAMNASKYKYSSVSRLDFLSEQLLLETPFVLVLVVASLFYLFSKRYLTLEKSLLIIFFTTMGILLIKGHVKAEYMASSYSAIFICGGIQLSDWCQNMWKTRAVKILAVIYFFLSIFLVPIAVPVLSVERFISYQGLLGIKASNTESKEEAQLPQFYADMHGWEKFAQGIAKACSNLSDGEMKKAVIVTNNYGEAGAMRYYRKKYNLPVAISRHNSHYLWGQAWIDNHNFEVFIVIGDNPDHLRDLFNNVQEQVEVIDCGLCMPYENKQAIHIVKDVKEGIDIVKTYFEEKNYD